MSASNLFRSLFIPNHSTWFALSVIACMYLIDSGKTVTAFVVFFVLVFIEQVVTRAISEK